MPSKTAPPAPSSPSSSGRPRRVRAAPAAFGRVTHAAGEADMPARVLEKQAGAQALAAAVPSNPLKPSEFTGEPMVGVMMEAPNPGDTGSTTTEDRASAKLGDGQPQPGRNPGNDPLDRARVDASGQVLTTNQGVAISDNQNSLKAGARGPTLLEDFILREKITHFDHERIPERVVHARGSAAHGIFECTQSLTDLTLAAPFAEAGKLTPVFVRFSTVAGERGSTDLARDVRGFAVKFYTDEGNWDLVGNNIPVFFIQDAMKFPDLVHAVKPEPHHAMPQAASAHDTFWDFAGLMPEIAHMLMWVMSDRAIPRSFSTMQGFGVHTFRMVNAQGDAVFVKFHWNPAAGTHSLVWDEAVKLSGADADFHRRDLWESIERGDYPTWDLQLQIFSEEQAASFSFDVLDPTKLIPEELVPLRTVGRMVLNRNPDNFFAETEQVAFATHHIIPGIDFSNDPLLQGRNHSYLDTQISRLGGPNFHELPINSAVSPTHNNQRDAMHRQAIPRGRVAYEPNSLGGGCPFQAGMRGLTSFPAPDSPAPDKLRIKPEKFADHYSQATLFYRSQTAVEQMHIANAFRFELSKVETPAVRERIVALLGNVDEALARRVADGLGMQRCPAPLPPVMAEPPRPEVLVSPALSLRARPGSKGVRGLRVALLVAEGCAATGLDVVREALLQQGAVPRFVAYRMGEVSTLEGTALQAEFTFENAPSVTWDAAVLPAGAAAQEALAAVAMARDFVRDQHQHGKTLLLLGDAVGALHQAVLAAAQLPGGTPDPGIVHGQGEAGAAASAFIQALAYRKHPERELATVEHQSSSWSPIF